MTELQTATVYWSNLLHGCMLMFWALYQINNNELFFLFTFRFKIVTFTKIVYNNTIVLLIGYVYFTVKLRQKSKLFYWKLSCLCHCIFTSRPSISWQILSPTVAFIEALIITKIDSWVSREHDSGSSDE